jgi:hypothetical protein
MNTSSTPSPTIARRAANGSVTGPDPRPRARGPEAGCADEQGERPQPPPPQRSRGRRRSGSALGRPRSTPTPPSVSHDPGQPSAGTPHSKVGRLVLDLVGQNDVRVLSGQERLVGELGWQQRAIGVDDVPPARNGDGGNRCRAFLAQDVLHGCGEARTAAAENGGSNGIDASPVDTGLVQDPHLRDSR